MRSTVVSSTIGFTSEAPLEVITAVNTKGTGLLDRCSRQFAVNVPIVGSQGFNSPLQREHFLENYMDVDDRPSASFQGRIFEAVDLGKPGTYEVRAKGMFTIRGRGQERIIASTLKVDDQVVTVRSIFPVLLAEHCNNIPKVVMQKLEPKVQVEVEMRFLSPTDQRE